MSGREIIIIGAGSIGTSIATHLAQRGERPLVLERHHVCAGTTGQSGGVVRQHYSNPKTAALARDALRIFADWSGRYEGSPGFVQTGVMLTAGAETEGGVRANVAMHRQLGIETAVLAVDDAAKIDDRIQLPDCTVVCWEPTAGVADPIATTHALAQTARSLGVEIREGVEVAAIAVASGKVAGIETSDGRIAADIVINAAGAWGPPLLAKLGHDLPISFSRHPMALVRRPADGSAVHPVVLDVHTDSYFLPRGEMTLIGKLGTMANDLAVDPDSYERGVTNAELARYRQSALKRMPSLARGVALGGWAGIYDDSIDAHPIVDAVPGAEGLFCALGMSGNCFKLSPVIGDLLSRRVLDGPGAVPELDLFRFDRFAEGASLERAFSSMSVLA